VDFVTEKRGAVVMGMRHQCFVRVELQMEFIAEKGGEGLLYPTLSRCAKSKNHISSPEYSDDPT
jgi:hypothetical protein